MKKQTPLKKLVALTLLLSVIPAYAVAPNTVSTINITTDSGVPHLPSEDLDGSFTPANPEDPDSDDVSYIYNWYQSTDGGTNYSLKATNALIDDGNLQSYFPFDNDVLDYAESVTLGAGGSIDSSGLVDGALNLDGDDHITSDLSSTIQSFSFWYKYQGDTTCNIGWNCEHAALIAQATTDSNGFQLRRDGHRDNLLLKIGGGINDLPSSVVSNSVWTHIVVTNDGTHTYAYVNGTLDLTWSNTVWTTVGNLSFGKKIGEGRYYNGLLDEVQTFDRQLTTTDISQLYYGGLNGGADLSSDLTALNDYWSLGVKGCDTSGCGTEKFYGDTTGSDPENGILIANAVPASSIVGPFATAITSGNPIAKMSVGNPTGVVGYIHKGLTTDLPCKSKYYNSTTGRVDDRSPYNNHATNAGATPAGTYFTLDGTDDSITLPASAGQDTTGTISLWVKLDAIAANDTLFADYEDSDDQILIAFTDGSTLRFEGTSGGSSQFQIDATGIGIGNWYHILAVFDTNDVRFYINGTQAGSTDTSSTLAAFTHNTIKIGDNPLVAGAELDGDLSGFKIYNRAFSAADATRLYDKGR